MPHKCTNCGRTFADGSKEMLSGCPDCGGNKFQFRPAGTSPDETKASESPESAASSADAASSSGAVGRAASTVKGWVGSGEDPETERADRTPAESARSSTPGGSAATETARERSPESDVSEPDVPESEADEPGPETGEDAGAGEDRAQASARSEVVADDELPERPETADADTVVEPQGENQPSLEELREELNSQFESIKVVEPGQYELNLMELYERDEYIIALKENGRYVIQVSDSWSGSDDS
ncbi:OapC/ArvC family zinc-ribbon domain-containing protein [Haladaptatus salinisoli]|uniref:OapC/ArvC family zinc-ribbon domain-containing protein n=1 Tax=Haladaptatus salinisoli TaxID=2884876 RepID=UPI001D0BCDF6|nr:Zn-ribbon containing protein [Haladaptatus salinisoli]